MNRESFIFYGSFFEALSCLEDDVRLKCYDAVISYALSGNEPTLDGVPKAVFALIKPQIDANNERYINGCKGGRPSQKTNGFEKTSNSETNGFENEGVLENQTITKHKPNENENVNDNDNENVKEKKRATKFVKPTLEEIRAYCQERNNGVDPERFFDFYESKGWKVGNQGMKDWKAAVRTWEQRDKKEGRKDDNKEGGRSSPESMNMSKETYDKIHSFPERNIDYAALQKEVLGNV